jgi:2-phosphoglycerate kinase
MVLSVDDERQHRSHFEIREVETEGARPFSKYIQNFDNIRKIQDYVLRLAAEQNVPVFPCYSMDTTISAVLDYVINRVFAEYTETEPEAGLAGAMECRRNGEPNAVLTAGGLRSKEEGN